ncbi:hypothetical protein Poli38472_011832 [Pythium oligandrum]|uniref:Uncharacterized protein n=1 Tax=Pythium oligandrum TaxID=41045 RepID=A0A8K1FES3_PYTOL|nr:hypothetical protein Poli38472_011832 [Pythium oligandrum]|eukprot:TMW58244.1 hypothetical protein Poli38472_011832 [Pythium oligandrum]
MMDWGELERLLAADGDGFEALADALASVDGSALTAPAVTQTASSSRGQSVSQPSKASPTASAVNDDGASVPRKQRKCRMSLAQEIKTLQATADEMEEQLASLRNRKRGEQGGNDVLDTLWESIADRQRRALDESKRENAWLRATVEDQLGMIDYLERLMAKTRSKTPPFNAPRMLITSTLHPLEDPLVEMEMQQDFASMLEEVDGIITDTRFDITGDERFVTTALLPGENGSSTIEVLDGRLFPFSYESVADGLWSMWTSSKRQSVHKFRYSDIQATNDSVKRMVQGELVAHGTRIQFRNKFVGRRVIRDNYTVLLAVMLIEPLRIDGSPVKGLFLRQRVWNIFREASLEDDEPVTYRQFYSLYTPQISTSGLDHQDVGLDMVTKLALETSVIRLNANNDALESRILDNYVSGMA